MSKKLRLFFLSVMVVLLGVSSAMSAEIMMTTAGDTNNPPYYSFDVKGDSVDIIIYHDGEYTFESGDIAKISFDETVRNVTIGLPAPNPDKAGNGTGGAWEIAYPATVTSTSTFNFVIAKSSNTTHAAIAASTLSFSVPAYVNTTVNVPFRVNDGYADDSPVQSMDFQLAVASGGVFTFGPEARIYGDSADVLNPTGFTGGSKGTYTIAAGGTVIVQNQWALKGNNLSVDVNASGTTRGTLEIAIPESTLDLRGKGDTTAGATINANGGNISVNKALTLIGEIHCNSGDVIHKTGTGTLTLSQSSSWPNPALSADIKTVYVDKGGLVLNGQPSWIAKGGAGVVASSDATFTANEKSIKEDGDSFDIKVGGTATATFAQHAIYKGIEIYPFDDYIYKDNGLTINVKDVSAYVAKGATLAVNGGSFALSTLKGTGTVTMTGSTTESPDKVVLIFTSPDASMRSSNNFEGTITGNVGFYATEKKSFDAQMFGSGDIKADNLLVYGPATLAMNEKTAEYLENVENIWLRGHRPGADNTKATIATSGLTVGGLILGNSQSFDKNSPDVNVAEIKLANLKVDGTSNTNGRATITLEGGVYATLSNLTLYANKEGDFRGTYAAPATGIYALTIDGSEQPSKLIIDGATVTGEGVAADLDPAEGVYQFQMTDNSDVRFLGDNGNAHHPIGKNTSLYVGQDAKLEMGRGAIIDGNIEFKGSSTAVGSSAYGDSDYPQESWFASGDNRWNDPSLDAFATFTTVVAKNNRVNGSSATDTSEYAVKVGGNVTFSTDVSVQPSTTAYPGRVLVRTKTHTNAFEGVTQTTLNRFRSIGSTSSSSTYRPDFLTPYDSTYGWRVTPLTEFQATGVVVETRNEYARLNIGEFSFTKGADTFGNGEFVAKATVTAWALGDELTITSPDTTATSSAKYMLVRGSNEKYYIADAKVYFRRNVEGEEEAESNVFDEDEWSTTFSSPDILMNGNFRLADDGTPEIELRGYSYGGNTLNDVTVMLKFTDVLGNVHTLNIEGVLPAYKTAPLSPSGTGSKFSAAKTWALAPFTFVENDNGIAQFAVEGMSKATSTTEAVPEVVNGSYVWKVKAVDGAYFIYDENRNYTKIQNIKLIRYDFLDADPVEIKESPDMTVITVDGDHAVVGAPSSALGSVNGYSATKWLAIRGDTSEGTLTTAPVAYTLIVSTNPADIITETGDLNQTVQIGGDSVSGKYEVDYSLFSGDVTLVPVNLPSWLGYNGGAGMISYTTGDLTGVEAGPHTFQVIAHDNNGTHKLYQFTVTVEGEPAPVVPHVEPTEGITDGKINVLVGETATATLTAVGLTETAEWSIAENENPEGLLAGTAEGNVYTLTVNAAGVAAGSYAYTVKATDLDYPVTVVVTAPTFEIADEPNDATYEGYNYRNVITAAGAAGKVTWTVTPARASDTWLTWVESGDDQLVLAGVLPDYDDGEDADNDHVFNITASVGTVYADNASTEEPYEITVSVEEDTMLPVSASADIVRPAEGVALGSVDKNYSVTVVFPTDPDEEGTVVASDYILDETSINLPEWISYEVISRDDNDDVLAIRLVVNPVPGVANGTKGTVRIPADGVTLGWNVVYNAASPLEITASPVAVSFDSPTAAAKTVTLSATNAIGTVTYTASVDKTGLTAAVSGDVLTLTPSAAGSYTVTVTGSTATQTATATVNVTVNSGTGPTPGSFSITATPAAVSFDSPTASAKTVTLSTNFLGATVTYTASVDKTGLSADVSGDVLTLTPSAAGSYTVTVTGSTATQTATATVNVTVNSGTGPTPGSFSITATPAAVSFDSPTASAQTVTLSTNFLGATVTYSAAVSPATGLTASVSGTTLTLTPSAAGTYVVTVTGTNGTRTATATVNVTVSSGPSTTFSISATPSTVTFTSVSAAVQTVTLSATGASGSVTYSADVTASSTGSTGLTDGLDLTVSGNTLTIDPLEAGTYTVTITGNTTTQTATTEITVVVSRATRVGSSGGGCDAGFGALALVLAAPLFLRRRRS